MCKRCLPLIAGALCFAALGCSALLCGGCAKEDSEASVAAVPEAATAAASATAAATAESPPPPALASEPPPVVGPGLPTAVASAAPLGALSLPDMRACLTKCSDDNRMRAVAPEQIEADCRAQCNKICLAHCEQANEPQKTRCKQDCEQQSGGIKLP